MYEYGAEGNSSRISDSLHKLWFKFNEAQLFQGEKLDHQLVESHVLVIVKHGEAIATVDLEEYRIADNRTILLMPGQTLGIRTNGSGQLALYILKFDVYSPAVDAQADMPFQQFLPMVSDPQIQSLCDLMVKCSSSRLELEQFRSQAAFLELIYCIVCQLQLEPQEDSKAALDRTKAYMENHYHENITIDQLARMAEISPKYYSDLFKKTYNVRAIDYLSSIRLRHAKQLILRSDRRLADVAHQVGYSDEFYFSRKFKKEVGLSPTAYLKKRSRKIAAYMSPVIGHLLALDLIPFAAPLHPKWTGYYYERYRSDISVHLSAYKFNQDWMANLEILKDADIDCIVSLDKLNPDELEHLGSIAPLHLVPTQFGWRDQLGWLAGQLGFTAEAENWVSIYKHKIGLIRSHLHKEIAGQEFLVLSLFKDQYYLCPTRGMRDVLCDDLQLSMSTCYSSGDEPHLVSIEEIAHFDPDRILLNVCQEPDTLHYWHTLQASSIWLSLKAVRKHQVHLLNSDPWREYSASACDRMADDLLTHLSGQKSKGVGGKSPCSFQ